MSAAVAIFAKAPVVGRVKTRLVPPLTPEEAAAVARACLEDSLRAFVPAPGGATVRLFLDGAPDSSLATLVASLGVVIAQQADGDLGARLVAAFRALRTADGDRVVAIGSDSPTLDPVRLTEAFAALESSDVVVGPAEDGGYYLIGVGGDRAYGVFEGIPWSTPGVTRATLARATTLGLTVRLLPAWYDLDDAASLRRAAEEGLERAPSLARVLAALRDRLASSASPAA